MSSKYSSWLLFFLTFQRKIKSEIASYFFLYLPNCACWWLKKTCRRIWMSTSWLWVLFQTLYRKSDVKPCHPPIYEWPWRFEFQKLNLNVTWMIWSGPVTNLLEQWKSVITWNVSYQPLPILSGRSLADKGISRKVLGFMHIKCHVIKGILSKPLMLYMLLI